MPHRPLWGRLATLVAVAAGLLLAAVAPPAPAASDPITIEAFVRESCPHCAKAEEFLAQLQKERPALKVTVRDVQKDPTALERLKQGAAPFVALLA